MPGFKTSDLVMAGVPTINGYGMLLACLNPSLEYFNMQPDDGVVKV